MTWLKVHPSVVLGTTFEHYRDAQARGYSWSPDKWRCIVCGREGYGTDTEPYRWSESCRRGHAPCPDCGRMLTTKLDGQPRRHTRCANRRPGGNR